MRSILFIMFLISTTVAISQTPNVISNFGSLGFINKKKTNRIDGKPISFYLNHPKIDKNAVAFFKGELTINNELNNCTFLDSSLTTNDETRPFYFFVFNSLVDLYTNFQNEKLAENCLAFIEKYPCNYFDMLNGDEFEINVVKWTYFVGIRLSNPQVYTQFQKEVDNKISQCPDYTDLWKSFFSEARKCRIK